jgi:signal transduction histidine kinase
VTIRQLFRVLYSLVFLSLLAMAAIVVLLIISQRNLNRSQRTRFESYRLCDELRQSSDNLTRFARAYAATGDPRYEQYYRDLLAIRDGEKRLPEGCRGIDVDFVEADSQPPPLGQRKAPLKQLMRELGFTSPEFSKLGEAEQAWNALESTDNVAMNVVKGRYDDGSGSFSVQGKSDRELAVRLLNDQSYERQRATVVKPIAELLAMVDLRTTTGLAAHASNANRYLFAIAGILLTMTVLMLASWVIIQRRVDAPIRALDSQTREVAADLDRLKKTIGQATEGRMAEPFVAQARQLHATVPGEIESLARTHDDMIAGLGETGAAVARVTAELAADKVALATANEELKRLSEAKSNFVSVVSHELRTPLTAISEGINLIADGSLGPTNDRQARFLVLVHRNCNRLGELIDDLLDLSNIEAGRMDYRPARLDLGPVVKEVAETFRVLAREKGLALDAMVPDVPVHVYADGRLVRRILTNLVSNALKFTDRGTITITAAANGENVRVSVQDTGIGIPLVEQARVFEKFHQVDHQDRGRPTGTGIGLSLTRQMVAMNHGRIWFESREGTGTTFCFTLPLHTGNEEGKPGNAT